MFLWKSSSSPRPFDAKDVVEFKQADLSKDTSIDKVFDRQFDYVINLCGETRFGIADGEYAAKCVLPAKKAAAAAQKAGCKKFIEISTAQVYKESSKPRKEVDGKLDPWTVLAAARFEAEKQVQAVQGLPWVILRPAYVYGPGDLQSLAPRLCCAAVYWKLKEKLQFLWDSDLKVNCVHVDDVVAAIVLAAKELNPRSVFNLADHGDQDQGQLCKLLEAVFKIKTDFVGNFMSNLARVNFASVVGDVNEKHVPEWSDLCSQHNILNTPLSPYISIELLYNNSLCVDGTAICKASGFNYKYPKMTEDAVKAQVKFAIDQGIFPNIL